MRLASMVILCGYLGACDNKPQMGSPDLGMNGGDMGTTGDLGKTGDMAMVGGGTLKLTSTSFAAGATIPTKYAYDGCGIAGGMNVSPALAWTGAPAGTAGFALIIDDPDAALGGNAFVHWVAYGMAATRANLAEGAATTTPADLKTTANDFGDTGYSGPCPPPGENHTYNFTLYALDQQIATATSAADLKTKMMGHIKEQALYTGTFAN
jgi:Raf kinase inhibitor-like YbhB/YbcL family protein